MAVGSQYHLKQAITNGMIPKEGPKVIPMLVDLRAVSSVELDFSTQNDSQQISFIQCVYVDNSLNALSVSIVVGGTGQKLTIAPGQQGYFPVLSSIPNKFVVSSTGAIQVPIFFSNVPLPLAQWGSSSNPAFIFDGSNGGLIVADPRLEALIANAGSGNGLNVNVLTGGGGGGTTGYPLFSTEFQNSGASGTNIIATSGSQKFRLSGIKIETERGLFSAGSSGQWAWTLYQGVGNSQTVVIAKGNLWTPPAAELIGSLNARESDNLVLWESPVNFTFTSTVTGEDLVFKYANTGSSINVFHRLTIAGEAF